MTTRFWFEQDLDKIDPAYAERLAAFAAAGGHDFSTMDFPPLLDGSKPARRAYFIGVPSQQVAAVADQLLAADLRPEIVEVDEAYGSAFGPDDFRVYHAACDAASERGLAVTVNDAWT